MIGLRRYPGKVMRLPLKERGKHWDLEYHTKSKLRS
jgi:hypothetical protein